LAVDDLKTWFYSPNGKAVHAVDGVSFDLAQGETLGIVGESGSGKSVLVRTVMSLTPPHARTTGTIRFDGRDLQALTSAERRSISGREISMIFQDPSTALNPVIRIGKQLTEALTLHMHMSRAATTKRAISLLRLVGIPEPERRMRNYPHELSGGLRQRVCIAIAIACDPKLLFADEPTTALDVTIQRQILDLLSDLQKRNGMAMVLITHDLGIVARRADRILVMYAGQVVETAGPKTLFISARHPYTAALLASVPRLEQQSHTRLAVIPGRPVDVVDPAPGCRFAPRCAHSQERCLIEDPVMSPGAQPGHTYACFYPVGTPEGEAALRSNLDAGCTAAGLHLTSAKSDLV
jgi:peptide/nickel transport system ATP-binding protein